MKIFAGKWLPTGDEFISIKGICKTVFKENSRLVYF